MPLAHHDLRQLLALLHLQCLKRFAVLLLPQIVIWGPPILDATFLIALPQREGGERLQVELLLDDGGALDEIQMCHVAQALLVINMHQYLRCDHRLAASLLLDNLMVHFVAVDAPSVYYLIGCGLLNPTSQCYLSPFHQHLSVIFQRSMPQIDHQRLHQRRQLLAILQAQSRSMLPSSLLGHWLCVLQVYKIGTLEELDHRIHVQSSSPC